MPMHEKEEFDPKDRMIFLKCQHILIQDVTICEMRENDGSPRLIKVPKGTIVLLYKDMPHYCRTKEGGFSFGCLYKITETSGVEIEDMHIGRVVAIPPQFLELRPDA